MPHLTAENLGLVEQACRDHLPTITELVNQCFARRYQLQLSDAVAWEATNRKSWSGGGLVIVLEAAGKGVACLFPADLLPEWASRPDEDQRSRMRGFAWELSRFILPADCEATQAAALFVPDMAGFIADCEPTDFAQLAPMQVSDSDTPCGWFGVVCPMASPQFLLPFPEVAAPVEEASAVEEPGVFEQPPLAVEPPKSADAMERLRRIPVPISVRLAEKRIPVSQLLSITPGVLVTFNKSCDDLLELYVNNALFCRGEAVKVGENFGLKINQIGVTREAQSKIVQG